MNELAEKLISILLSSMILGQAYLVRRRVGTWVFPACLYGLFWFAFTIIPLVLVFLAPASPLAIGYILVTCCVFSLSSLRFDWRAAFSANSRKGEHGASLYDTALIRRTFYVLSGVIPVLLVQNARAQGVTLSQMIFSTIVSAAAYAELRNQENIVANVYGQLSNVAIYVATVLGGFVFHYEKKPWKKWGVGVLALAPSLVVMVTQSSKGMFFLCAAFFAAAIWICRLRVGDLALLPPGTRRPLLVLTVVVVAAVGVSFLSRGLHEADDSDVLVDGLARYAASYTSGHLYAFSDWFSDRVGRASTMHYDREPATMGFYTVMPIFEAMGSTKQVPAGVYDEYFKYGEILTSNIYTQYRGMITDFGLGGSLLFMLVVGFLLHLSFFDLLVEDRPILSTAVFVFMVGYFYTSFIISLLIWKSVYASFALLCAVLYANLHVRFAGFTDGQPEERGPVSSAQPSSPAR